MNMNSTSPLCRTRRGGDRLLLLCLLPLLAVVPPRATAGELPDIRRDATVIAIEEVMPSVVNIATRSLVPVRDEFDALYRQLMRLPNSYISLGSGVIIDEEGYLLTNDHVVRRAQEIQVQLNITGDTYRATVVASDPKADVALLKIEAPPGAKFRAIKFAPDDDVLLGETVLALGNPFGLGGSVSRGILSSKSRTMPEEGAPLDARRNYLQTDAPINPGNSGGPLVNLRGELIGINVQVQNDYNGQPAQGIGFAIPIRLVEEALSDSLPTEFVKSFWFGARVKVGTSPLVITAVQPDSPAGRAGLMARDAILRVNGKPPRSFIDFVELLATNAATEIRLEVQRGLERNNIVVKLVPEKDVFNANLVRDKLGLSLEALTPRDVATRYHLNAPGGGFVITGVQDGGPAARAELQSGTLVLAIDGETAADLNLTALAKRLHSKKPGDMVQLNLGNWQHTGAMNVFNVVPVKVTIR
jgi:serine protease Do